MKNKIELTTMSPVALIKRIEQLWAKINFMEEEIRNLKVEVSSLKLENQELKVENQELKNALARAKKFRPSPR